MTVGVGHPLGELLGAGGPGGVLRLGLATEGAVLVLGGGLHEAHPAEDLSAVRAPAVGDGDRRDRPGVARLRPRLPGSDGRHRSPNGTITPAS
ncbi:hypothetical protein, partial [Streptomyces sp. CAI-78]|uniref:hypothetical protein n=1 Tax=Streptomyces sp. CAI-78 TaxID=1169746 RepID=UPI0020CA635C